MLSSNADPAFLSTSINNEHFYLFVLPSSSFLKNIIGNVICVCFPISLENQDLHNNILYYQ